MENNLVKASKKLAELDFNMSFGGIEVNVFWFRAMCLCTGDVIQRHSHSSYEFHIVKSGACRVVLDDGEYDVKSGEMYITPPGIFHKQVSCGDTDYVEYCLNCDIKKNEFATAEDLLIYNTYKNMTFAISENGKPTELLFEKAFGQAINTPFAYYKNIQHIIFLIINSVASAISPSDGSKYDVTEKSDFNLARFKEIKRYIIDNLSVTVKVSEIAKIMYLSEKQIGRIIKQYTDKSTKEYILSLKHEKAKEYLKYSENSVSTIAEKLGFSSVQAFVTFFSKREGYTPYVFRKNVHR